MNAFEKLIKKYKETSLVDIAREFDKYSYPEENLQIIKGDLTGYSYIEKCILCQDAGIDEDAAEPKCEKCFWLKYTNSHCTEGKNAETCDKIQDAETIEEIHEAYKQRAAYMEEVLKKNKKQTNKHLDNLKYGDTINLMTEKCDTPSEYMLIKQYSDPVMINFMLTEDNSGTLLLNKPHQLMKGKTHPTGDDIREILDKEK